ncbi:flocculation protein FLO11-like [Scophthalmus maximus]|uniref:flocculation protein FLO11-like n=1 Tax=Scophthalmus maximus TaxID=52904 RepID=UPI001FA89DB7|nr:flocculation protein FLO11-like [Scophthalmus maximus]
MSFANLFTSLSAVDGDATHRNQSDVGKRGNGRKRKPPCEQTGPDNKKHRYEARTSRSQHTNPFTHDDSTSMCYRMPNIEHASTGFTKEEMHKHSDNIDNNYMHHKKKNYRGRNNRNVYKQQQQKKMVEGQESLHRPYYRGRGSNRDGCYQTRPTSRRGGGDRKHGYDRQFHAKTPRSMTQEFKEQNTLLVDGQLLCRHFLWGRCIKGDECQLKHIQGYNDLVKEVCKFYVQGFCSKGESCPYMHKSFPCKFFHRKGNCSQGEDCRFSHEPLNETTGRLLDEALKRENDLYELSKKAQQVSPGQPATPDESEVMEENRTDVPIQQLSFYNSGGTNAEQEALLCKTEELCGITETTVPPEASDSAQLLSPLSTGLNREEPVCYSVEAVLGPQLFKPFPSFFSTPGTSMDSLPLSGPPTSTAEQSKAPYSVGADNTVRSRKSVASSALGYLSTHLSVQSVFYTPKSDCEELTDPLRSSEAEKVPYSPSNRIETNKPQERMFRSLPSLKVHTNPMSKTRPDVTPAQRAYREGKLESLQSPAAVAETSVSSKRKGDLQESTHLLVNFNGVLPFAATKHRIQTFTPTPLRPRLSGQTPDSQASVKTLCASLGYSEFKGPAGVPAESFTSSAKTSDSRNSSVIRRFTAKQPTETHQSSKKSQSALIPGSQRHYSTETAAECSSRVTRCDDLSVGCSKTQKRSFCNLFASPIADSLKPTPGSLTPACARGFIQASCPAPQSTQSKGLHVQTAVEPDKASATSFLGLFAAPLGAAPPPCMQSQPDYSRTASCSQDQPAEDPSRSSDSKQRASISETTLPHLDETDMKRISRRPTFSKHSPSPKTENEDDLSEAVNQPAKQQENPVRGIASDSLSEMSSSPTPCCDGADPSTTQAHRQLPDISSPKRSAVAASANSVLKTLFLCLDPFVQDAEQRDSIHISVPPESEQQDQSCISAKQQRKSKKKGRQKKKTQHSHQQSTDNSTDHQPSAQTSVSSLEATVGSNLSAPAGTEPPARTTCRSYR